MDGSSRDLRLQIAGLVGGKIDLNQFQTWIARAEADIELFGMDEDVDLLDRVTNLLAEYTGNHITEHDVIDTLRAEFSGANEALAAALRPSA